MMTIDTLEQLRTLYPVAKERALKKQLSALDPHCRSFIALSPFVVVASSGVTRAMDASPRGGPPGFVQVLDERTLLLPEPPATTASTRWRTSCRPGKSAFSS